MTTSTVAGQFYANGSAAVTNSTATEEQDVPTVTMIDDGTAYGYQCAKVVRDNTVTDIPLTFFLDLSMPLGGSEQEAMAYVQRQLIGSIAQYYGVSDGSKCENPPLDGSTWLVQILSKTTDWSKDNFFDKCRELSFDETSQDCFVYQAVVTGSVLGGSMDDVLQYMEQMINSDKLTVDSNYQALFLGAAQTDPTADTGRDNLGSTSSVQESQSVVSPTSDRQTVTIVGGLLVAAFCVAFLGIGFVLWRRRQEWRLKQQDLILDLELNKQQGATHPSDGGDGDDDFILDGAAAHAAVEDEDPDHPMMMHRQAQYPMDATTSNNSGQMVHRKLQPGEDHVTFDLGASFKDQLMGVHGSRGGNGGRPSGSGLYGMGRGPLNSDADSDADSWAQTDGTIGSLEAHLDPITAEV